ncbi:putative protein family UPF0406 [Metarhizium rileyi]|uniref:U6 snRNA phosphodiesterase n=1 Tax=Metarhizium rileyi (strain RCEF 4871) TaxID=1649241 RepID=A0A167BZB6_METRR|nr:putative protein family UPF0406 [Metarhizium rileyi RCEF 4871]
MALVDYSSSSDDDEPPPPPSKRLKGQNDGSDSKMPPLPATFHDLYASTVRQSVVDDPSLHQGRKRLHPHVPGNWPTHVYIEWHPTKAQHDTLDALVKKAQEELGGGIQLHNSLNSDLGTDLPLHISLSRPLSLPSSVKDAYFSSLTRSIRGCGTGEFAVRPAGLAWHRSPDSNRTFFVLRVVSAARGVSANDGTDRRRAAASTNPELMVLLTRCNRVAARFDQLPLYQQTQKESADEAFHVSIGWTLGAPDEETCLKVLGFFRDKEFDDIHTWHVPVDGVKAKTGNVVSHIPLTGHVETNVDDESVTSLYGS